MALASVLEGGRRLAAVVDGDRVLVSELDGGADALIAGGGSEADLSGKWRAVDECRLDAVLRPPVVLCAGQNYRDHLDEKAPVEVRDPEFFIKAGQTISAADEPAYLDTAVTRKLDYETELGVVIGRPGHRIAVQDAYDHVLGYLVLNDLTARDRQVVRQANGSFGLALGPGKNFDGATRVGRTLVSIDAVGQEPACRLTTRVNGELRQDNSTANMVFSIAEVIAYLSTLITLLPGTIIATGTPGGTGWGMDSELGGTSVTPTGCVPARYLSVGECVTSAIEGVGELSFEVAAT
jgi:2-keto-4-pentenoate hydratase/2-oxohepta-3-ene-1,7-dioic acid hydratase in catechol pathway